MKIRQMDYLSFKDEAESEELTDQELVELKNQKLKVKPVAKSNKAQDEYAEVRQGLKRLVDLIQSSPHSSPTQTSGGQTPPEQRKKLIARYSQILELIDKNKDETSHYKKAA